MAFGLKLEPLTVSENVRLSTPVFMSRAKALNSGGVISGVNPSLLMRRGIFRISETLLPLVSFTAKCEVVMFTLLSVDARFASALMLFRSGVTTVLSTPPKTMEKDGRGGNVMKFWLVST